MKDTKMGKGKSHLKLIKVGVLALRLMDFLMRLQVCKEDVIVSVLR